MRLRAVAAGETPLVDTKVGEVGGTIPQGGLVGELEGLHLYSPVYVLGDGEGEEQEVEVVLQHFLALHGLDPGALEGLRVGVVSGTGSLQILQVHSSVSPHQGNVCRSWA